MSCRTGHQDEQGHLWQAQHAEPIYELIGGEIESYDLLRPYAPDTVALDDEKYGWMSWGDMLNPNGNTETWGIYTGDFYAGKPSVIFNRLEKGTVTYVGADSNQGDLELAVLKKLYNRLGIDIENYPKGVLVEYRDGFGIAMNYSNKEYEMILPVGSEILVGEKIITTAGVLVWKLR